MGYFNKLNKQLRGKLLNSGFVINNSIMEMPDFIPLHHFTQFLKFNMNISWK